MLLNRHATEHSRPKQCKIQVFIDITENGFTVEPTYAADDKRDLERDVL